jgi:curved DNA-binding protein CbpA
MPSKNYYQILGVSRKADRDALKRAYRNLARRYHPDVNPEKPAATDKLKEINEAYATLINPAKRAAYDNTLRPAYPAYTTSSPLEDVETEEDFEPVDTTSTNRDFIESVPMLAFGLIISLCMFAMFAAFGAFGSLTFFEQGEENAAAARQATRDARQMTQHAATATRPSFQTGSTTSSNPNVRQGTLSVAESNRLLNQSEDSDRCTIDLVENAHNCAGLDAISFNSQPHQQEVALNIDLNPGRYRQVLFIITYTGPPNDWTVNIGDSRWNSGYGGDDQHQIYNAELRIRDEALTIFGRDETPGTRRLLHHENFVQQSDTVYIEISDEQVRLGRNDEGFEDIQSEYLYALGGQTDYGERVDYTIYAAFNRTIAEELLNGSGVGMVEIRLVRVN